jgi:hypothetical protein
MAARAWNLRKWMVAVAIFLFWKKVGLFFVKCVTRVSPYKF